MTTKYDLEILPSFSFIIPRAWAITHLEGASDIQLEDVMLQLVHLLKFEPYVDSGSVKID